MSKTIIVCGASQGIGAEIVHELARDSSNVIYALSRNKERMDEQFKGYSNVHPVSFDLSKKVKEQVANLFDGLESIDLLINNAGYLVKEDFSNTHYFTKSYAEHLKNAKKYRAALDARGIK